MWYESGQKVVSDQFLYSKSTCHGYKMVTKKCLVTKKSGPGTIFLEKVVTLKPFIYRGLRAFGPKDHFFLTIM